MKEPQLSGIAKALAAQGRHGDDTLIHVSRKELEALNRMGDGLGIKLTKNPQTGLPEAFNWLGMLGGVAGGIVGTILLPGVGTAIGSGLGSAAGTAAGGGTTEQALMAGVIGGVTGYAGAGVAGSLASAGEQAIAQGVTDAATQGVTQGVTQGATDTAAQGITQGVTQGATDATSQTALQQIAQGASQNSGILNSLSQQAGQGITAEGSSQAAGSVVNGAFVPNPIPLQSVPMSYGDKLAAGWNQVTSSPSAFGNFAKENIKGIATTGIGALGVGAINPTESTITTEPDDSGQQYKGEMYIDPVTGQRRSRAVPMARGGDVYGDYDGADEAPDGGYSPGGGLNFAEGGEAADYAGGIANAVPTPETIAIFEAGTKLGPKKRRREEEYAGGGGIGDLGGYSDGGRLLRGAGNGTSDSIPATIENKRPARLADGEFVLPARIVSEIGNGSTEAGARELYKMMDRIQARRRKTVGKDKVAFDAKARSQLPA